MDRYFLLRVARFHHDLHHHHGHHCGLGHRREDEAEDVRQRPRRTVWVQHWLTEARRRELSHYYNLLNIDMGNAETAEARIFRNYTRLTPDVFLEVLDAIRPAITRQDTRMRQAIEPGLKLAVALRFLATGDI